MANTHSFVIRTLEDWQDDSINCAGVAAVDLDNGQFVTRGALGLTSAGGYEFTCSKPAANATALWLVETPPVGDTLDEQIHDDPRYFYNKAGKAFSIKGMRPEFSFIEVPDSAFSTAPTAATPESYAKVDTNGRLVATNSAPDAGTYFSIEAKHSVEIGMEVVPTWILKCVRN
jgi:hypothetical protein